MKVSCPRMRAGIVFGLLLPFAFAQPASPVGDDASDSRDAAFLMTLPSDRDIAQVTGPNGAAGEVLVEVYDSN